MDYLVFLIGFFEARLKKRKEPPKTEGDEGEAKTMPEFVEGRIYQMEDGSFAKYAGGGKFLKVRK